MKPIRRRMRDHRGELRRGAALVEFAIVLPVLLLVLLGIIEFGQIMFVRNTLINAARQGAYRATLPGATDSIVEQTVQAALNDGGLGDEPVQIAYTPSTPPDNLAEVVTVTVNYGDISLLGGIFGEFPLNSTCTMFRGPTGF